MAQEAVDGSCTEQTTHDPRSRRGVASKRKVHRSTRTATLCVLLKAVHSVQTLSSFHLPREAWNGGTKVARRSVRVGRRSEDRR